MACPYCNRLRAPRFYVADSSQTLCSSPFCVREQFSVDTSVPDVIAQEPQYLQAYKKYFRSIGRGVAVLGRLQSIYNVRIIDITSGVGEVVEVLRTIHSNQVNTYKVAISFGRLMKHTEDGKERITYFHASANNSSIFTSDEYHSPYIEIQNLQDLERCIQMLADRLWMIHTDRIPNGK